jgi:hypothetical protein
MRRRRVLTILSALSLLLCVAVVALWVRSQRVVESVALTSSAGWSCAAWSSVTGFEICGTHGLRAVETTRAYHARPRTAVPTVHRSGGRVYVEDSHLGRPVPRARWGGFGWTIDPSSAATDSRFGTYATSYWSLVVPYWFLAAITSAPVLWQVRTWLRGRVRHGTGLCPACGYDLRATPETYPECGALPQRTTAL